MLRYACRNNNGKVDLLRCASALGKSFETILTTLDLLEDDKIINVSEKNCNYYKLTLNENSDISVIFKDPKFKEVQELIKECEIFQNNLMTADLETYIQ